MCVDSVAGGTIAKIKGLQLKPMCLQQRGSAGVWGDTSCKQGEE